MQDQEHRSDCVRSVPFRAAADTAGDGLTLDGYAAVFDTPTTIQDWEGQFEETIAPGAFTRALAEATPVLLFDHGQHPLIGSIPLGHIDSAAEDSRGLHIRARLTDNWLIQPVRDAVRDGGIKGMSFRFSVPDGGDVWTRRKGMPDHRLIREAYPVPELGPVVFPAYEPTTVAVRSALAALPGLDAAVRQILMPGMESGDDPGALAQAACAALDAAMAACAGTPAMLPQMQQACALMLAADSALDGLLAALGVPDLPDTGTGRATNLTGQLAARSGGGGDSTAGQPGNGQPAPSRSASARHRRLRLEGIIQ